MVFHRLLVLFVYVKCFTQATPWLEQIARQELLNIGCRHIIEDNNYNSNNNNNNNNNLTGYFDHILVDHKHKLLYCYVPKVACTNWKRILMVLTGAAIVPNLVDIPGSLAHAENSTLRLSQLPAKQIPDYLRNYTAFVMVRHPFERLLSAYRNKFETNAYSHYFKMRYGRYIVRKYRQNANSSDLENGDNVSFREFVQYIIDEGASSNEHWQSVYDLCHPCTINYTFIGHYETLSEDARVLLELVEAPASITFPFTRMANTSMKLRHYFQQLPLAEIQALYQLYQMDFKLFGYNLEDLLGFDLG